jgi:hypothetical protein
MRFSNTFARAVAIVLVPAFLSCVTAQSAAAAMVSTARVVDATAQAGARAKVQAFVARADVQDVMTSWGVSPAEASARVASLTDQEVTDLAARIDAMPAGGHVVGIILGAILFVFLVLLLTDLLGLTDVFPFIKKKR